MWQNIKSFIHSQKSIMLFLPFLLLSSLLLFPNKVKAQEQIELPQFPQAIKGDSTNYYIWNKEGQSLRLYYGGSNKLSYLTTSDNITIVGPYDLWTLSSDKQSWNHSTSTESNVTVGFSNFIYWSKPVYSNSSYSSIAFQQAPVPQPAPLQIATEQGLKLTLEKLKTTFGQILPGGLVVLSMLLVVPLVLRLRAWFLR